MGDCKDWVCKVIKGFVKIAVCKDGCLKVRNWKRLRFIRIDKDGLESQVKIASDGNRNKTADHSLRCNVFHT